MAENQEGQEPQKTPEGEPKPSEGGDDTLENGEALTPEQIADLKKKADASSQNFERLKKAEKDLKDLKAKHGIKDSDGGSEPAPDDEVRLSTKEVLALTESKISSEDYDEVVRVSKILGKSVSEALKDKTLISILAERAEERRTANATQTRGGARGTSTTSGASSLEKAEKTGEVPTTDEGMREMAEARLARLRKK